MDVASKAVSLLKNVRKVAFCTVKPGITKLVAVPVPVPVKFAVKRYCTPGFALKLRVVPLMIVVSMVPALKIVVVPNGLALVQPVLSKCKDWISPPTCCGIFGF